MNIVDSTSDYEGWLGEMADVQRSAIARKHNENEKRGIPAPPRDVLSLDQALGGPVPRIGISRSGCAPLSG